MWKRNAAIAAVALVGFAGTGHAQAASIDGSWSGNGKVTLKNGSVEPVRCRIKYEPGGGRTFVIHANCSHANGIFKQSGRIVQKTPNSYSGRLYSDQFGVSGNISIAVRGNKQTLTAVSANGRASVSLSKR